MIPLKTDTEINQMYRNFSESVESGDISTKNISNKMEIKTESLCEISDTSAGGEECTMYSKVYTREDLKLGASVNENTERSEYEKEDTNISENLMFSNGLTVNINRGECSYKIEEVYIKSEPVTDDVITQQESDSTASHTDLKCEPKNYNSGNVDSSEVSKVHDTDMFTEDFSSYYKTEELDIKTEHVSDSEDHTSCEKFQDPPGNEATNPTAAALYKCKECDEAFIEMNFLHRHMETHTPKESNKCEKCGKAFSNTGNLNRHMRLHIEGKSYTCEECGKEFSDSSRLNNHIKLHTVERSCKECGKAFSNSGNLNRHMRLHTGEKPYSCIECGKAFSQMGGLNKHMMLHTGEKPYDCKECGKAFSRRDYLDTHMRLHTGEKPYNCGECGKAFSDSCNLHRHMKCHRGEKPYTCQECGKAFSGNCTLSVHMRIHTGEKPYNCIECGKAFGRTDVLNRHMKLHT